MRYALHYFQKLRYLPIVAALFLYSLPARAAVQLVNPLQAENIQDLIGLIIKNLYVDIIGMLALVMFIVGGYFWLTSGGNPEKVKKGRDVIVWTIIGLIIFFGAYTIINFIFESLPLAGNS